MSGDAPLAHSAPWHGGRAQPYAEHVSAVTKGAVGRAREMLQYASDRHAGLAEVVEAAAAYHDLGKLDPDIQSQLAKGRGASLCWDHIDAGVAHLMAAGAEAAAWLVRAHHAPGLPAKAEHFDPDGLGRQLRGRRNDDDHPDRHNAQIARTDADLLRMLAVHTAVAEPSKVPAARLRHGLATRLALSCLVDADHEDTAFADTGRRPPEPAKPRWCERLARLDRYVASLPPASNLERARQRAAFYAACRHCDIDEPLVACEGPVGIGKTTAVVAYILARAIATERKLRRIVVVAPYTNIISQTAARLREALTLPGEDPEEVVAEHHHRADFSAIDARELAVLWLAPVVVTTAVQFFETLGANSPAALRKLNALPGSAVFLDEAHAALPAGLWPQNWRWLTELIRDWSCRFVFASGSLARFWENSDIIDPPTKLPELLSGDLRQSVLGAERRRIAYCLAPRFPDVARLAAFAAGKRGPRLVILNTVQSAAVLAREMRQAGHDVLHLSTALTPRDRERILENVTSRLDNGDADWTLVATSCVEAGVDLSFRTVLRERFSAASLIQVGGRVNRHGEGEGSVFDFLIDPGGGITGHPAAKGPSTVLARLLNTGAFEREDPAAIVTKAMAEEIGDAGMGARNGIKDRLVEAERCADYPGVAAANRPTLGSWSLTLRLSSGLSGASSSRLGSCCRAACSCGRRVSPPYASIASAAAAAARSMSGHIPTTPTSWGLWPGFSIYRTSNSAERCSFESVDHKTDYRG